MSTRLQELDITSPAGAPTLDGFASVFLSPSDRWGKSHLSNAVVYLDVDPGVSAGVGFAPLL